MYSGGFSFYSGGERFWEYAYRVENFLYAFKGLNLSFENYGQRKVWLDMKLLHTADWHLGKRLDRFDRQEEQVAIMEEICTIAESEAVDVVLIAGDLFDTYNPPVEAVENFYKTCRRLSGNGQRAVIAIAGNHDSPDRIEAPDPLAREHGIIFAGYPHSVVRPFELESGLKVLKSEAGFVELALPRCPVPLRLLLTPYANEIRMRRYLGWEDPEAALRRALEEHWAALAAAHCDEEGVNLLVTHLFMIKEGSEVPEEPEDEKPIQVGGAEPVFTANIPEQMQYAALGHLHRHQEMGGGPCPVVYSGSPLEYSFAEAGQEKSVVLLEAEPGAAVAYRKVPLHAGRELARERFFSVQEAVEWLEAHQEVFVELTLETESYISSAGRKALGAAHSRIIGPIPVIRDEGLLAGQKNREVNLNQSREALFKDYFRERFGQEVNEELVHLFREITGLEEEVSV